MRRSRALFALATAARAPPTAPPRLSAVALRALLDSNEKILSQMDARLGDAAAHLAEVMRGRDELLAFERKNFARAIAIAEHKVDVLRAALAKYERL